MWQSNFRVQPSASGDVHVICAGAARTAAIELERATRSVLRPSGLNELS